MERWTSYSRSKLGDYAALAETVAAVLRPAIAAYPEPLCLQQIQQRVKAPDSLRKKLEDRGILTTTTLETDIKDLAGCRLIWQNCRMASFKHASAKRVPLPAVQRRAGDGHADEPDGITRVDFGLPNANNQRRGVLDGPINDAIRQDLPVGNKYVATMHSMSRA
jgi:hypothetical protein